MQPWSEAIDERRTNSGQNLHQELVTTLAV